MRTLGIALLALSVLLGGLALWGLRSLGVSHAAAQPAAAPPSVTYVVTAARPIGFGETLQPASLRLQAWPREAQPAGAFHALAPLTLAHRVALMPIAAGEPILSPAVSGPGGRASLASLIRPGRRASAIRIDDVVGVAGFVEPGDLVDVLLARSQGSAHTAYASQVLLQGVRVLAVDQEADPARNKPMVAKTATLEVTPEQAKTLAWGAQAGALSLALRAAGDLTRADDDPAPARPRRRAARLIPVSHSDASGVSVEVDRGSQTSDIRVAAE